jgi:hypothetical protein
MAETEEELAAMAARLSGAQRKLVLILSGNWATRSLAEQEIQLDPTLLERATPLRSGHERVRLTPLGLALRAHLQDQPK